MVTASRGPIVHGVEPGTDMKKLYGEVAAIYGDTSVAYGFEVDVEVALKGIPGVPECPLVRDRAGKTWEPLEDLIRRGREAGFEGPIVLDLKQGRGHAEVIALIKHLGDPEVYLHTDSVTWWGFGNPAAAADQKPIDAWNLSRVILTGFVPQLLEPYLGSGMVPYYLTGPRHREEMLELIARFDSPFVYWIPTEIGSLVGDKEEVTREDIRGFKRHGLLERVMPFGRTETLKRFRELWSEVLD